MDNEKLEDILMDSLRSLSDEKREEVLKQWEAEIYPYSDKLCEYLQKMVMNL